MAGEKNLLRRWADASTQTDPAAAPTGSDSRVGRRRSSAGARASFSIATGAAAAQAAAAPTPSAPKRRCLPRPDSGFFDADMAMPSVRTFQVRYLRGFQLPAPKLLVDTGTITPAGLAELARVAVVSVSHPRPPPAGEAGRAGADAHGNCNHCHAHCVFTLGELSATDQATGSQHFDLRVTEVLSLKVVGNPGKDTRACSIILVTRGTGVSPADMVRCHWIEFDNLLALKGFSRCMNDAFTAAHDVPDDTIPESKARWLRPAARALSICPLLADSVC